MARWQSKLTELQHLCRVAPHCPLITSWLITCFIISWHTPATLLADAVWFNSWTTKMNWFFDTVCSTLLINTTEHRPQAKNQFANTSVAHQWYWSNIGSKAANDSYHLINWILLTTVITAVVTRQFSYNSVTLFQSILYTQCLEHNTVDFGSSFQLMRTIFKTFLLPYFIDNFVRIH